MTTQSRKQREIQEREQKILGVARSMLLEHGYFGLNMDRIAEAVEYSKGTVYNHFRSKEDLIGALMVQTMTHRAELFHRAVSFDGRPRERICAVGLADQLFFSIDPDHFRIEQLVTVGSLNAKVSDERHQQLLEQHQRLLACLESVVTDAIEVGDLILPDGRFPLAAKPSTSASLEPKSILFGLWSVAVGSQYIASDPFGKTSMADLDLLGARWSNYHTLLDGYGWKPLFDEWDYAATMKRLTQEVFADECKLVESR